LSGAFCVFLLGRWLGAGRSCGRLLLDFRLDLDRVWNRVGLGFVLVNQFLLEHVKSAIEHTEAQIIPRIL
jgi:hypothetical protein